MKKPDWKNPTWEMALYDDFVYPEATWWRIWHKRLKRGNRS